jgi:uncharacterized membrane protein YozB (DUF420 family)
MDYPGWDGFLGTRASLMLDVVCLGMAVVVVVLGWSVRQVRVHRRYQLHKRVQLALAVALLVVLTVFEVDVRLHGWQERSAGQLGGSASSLVMAVLAVHLFFAVSTVILWLVVIVQALRRFPSPPEPGTHSAFHRRWARVAAWDMVITTLTGWTFYVLAFVV